MHFLLLFHLFYHNQASKYKSAVYTGCLYKRGENIYESQMFWIRAQIYLYYLAKKATQGSNAYSKNDSSWYLGNIFWKYILTFEISPEHLSIKKMKAKLINLGSKSKKMFKHHMLHIDSNIEKEYNLGRSRNAQCMILDENVSRRHATIKFDSTQGWTILDKKVKMCQFFWVCLTCIILFFL